MDEVEEAIVAVCVMVCLLSSQSGMFWCLVKPYVVRVSGDVMLQWCRLAGLQNKATRYHLLSLLLGDAYFS